MFWSATADWQTPAVLSALKSPFLLLSQFCGSGIQEGLVQVAQLWPVCHQLERLGQRTPAKGASYSCPLACLSPTLTVIFQDLPCGSGFHEHGSLSTPTSHMTAGSQETRVGPAIPPKGKAQDGQTLLARTVTGKLRFKRRGSRNYLWENSLSHSSSVWFWVYAWFCPALRIQRLTLQRLIQKNSLPAYILIWGWGTQEK